MKGRASGRCSVFRAELGRARHSYFSSYLRPRGWLCIQETCWQFISFICKFSSMHYKRCFEATDALPVLSRLTQNCTDQGGSSKFPISFALYNICQSNYYQQEGSKPHLLIKSRLQGLLF